MTFFRLFSTATRLLFIISIVVSLYSISAVANEATQANTEISDDSTNETEDIEDAEDTEDEMCPEDSIEITNDDEDEEPFFSFLDTPQQFVSSGVESFAQTMDEFFSEDKVFYNSSGSYLKLTMDTLYNEQGDTIFSADFRLKLRLPHTKEKTRLIIETDADKRADENKVQSNQLNTQEVSENNYFAGFQTTIEKEKSNWHFKPSIGFKLSRRPDLYTKLRFGWQREFTKWGIHWNETAYSFHFLGSGLDSSLEFNRKISEKNLFRATSFARWTDTNRYFELSQSFSMFHTLSERRALSYYVAAYAESEPTTHATQYLIGANYRQRIHKDYLFFELIPQILYQKENDFHSEPSLTFRIEMIFKK